jgi:glutathione S-transferase
MITYDLWYWTGIPGRGEFVRLPLEAAGIAYYDCAREEGDEALVKHVEKMPDHPAFAVPLLEGDGLKISQVANILLYLGEKHAFAPKDIEGRLWVNQLQLTIADMVAEAHNVHHPVAAGLYYEDQDDEAMRAATEFREERMPKFLDHFERAATGTPGDWLAGETWSYADTSLFQLLGGLHYAFPRRMATLAPNYPQIAEIAERVSALPRLTEYLASARRLSFNEGGLFRHYPELDAP